ncbi:MAG TPA: hypothetical protein VNL35_21400 [Chloroflexota bacterium]|nr:hypothetical protein [Chloroflexota bacterium]
MSALATSLALAPSKPAGLRAAFRAAGTAPNAAAARTVWRSGISASPTLPTGMLTFLTCALVPDAVLPADHAAAIPPLPR